MLLFLYVENFQRYPGIIKSGEEVIITEKLHGASARFCFTENSDGEMTQFCGTRKHWIKEDDKNIYWRAFRQNPAIGVWCQKNPNESAIWRMFRSSSIS